MAVNGTCPGCRGTIAGDIQRAEQRLHAAEALAAADKPDPSAYRRAHASSLVFAMPAPDDGGAAEPTRGRSSPEGGEPAAQRKWP